MTGSTRADSLAGRRILVVEDDYFIASEVALSLRKAGATVLGPVGNVADAVSAVGAELRPDAAVVDINLRGEMAFEVADALMARAIPFVFATGYDHAVIPPPYASVPRCTKPVSYRDLLAALAAQVNWEPGAAA